MRRNGRSSQRSFFLKAMEIDLQSAACDGDQPKVMKLLAAGANKDAADDDGATPMFMAAENGHAQVLKMLLAAGANKDAASNAGATPVYMAAQNGHAEVIKMLPDPTADPPTTTAPRRRLPPTLRKLLCRQTQHSRPQ